MAEVEPKGKNSAESQGRDSGSADVPNAGNDASRGGGAIDLAGAECIGRGWKRDCYVHPGEPALCIKVSSARPRSARPRRQRLTNWLLARETGEALNRREWEAYRRYGAILAPYVPRCHGFIRTSRGPGLVVDLVRDKDGRPSPNLRKWLSRSSPDAAEALLLQFRSLFDLLEREEIWLMDLNLMNFLVQDTGDGRVRPWLSDLKRLAVNKEIFQPAGWSDRLKRLKLARRIDRFQAKVRAEAAQ